ncbi:MAG: fumarylacetoacetate hydrolase family protein [Bacteroidales bacterium]
MKIICIGRNYIDHAREMQNPVPEEPVFFLKPESALLRRNRPFFYPEFSNDIHYELEVVIRINKVGKYIPGKYASTYYNEIALGIDFTARDLQKKCKEKGLPWEIAKGFDNAAALSKFKSIEQFNQQEIQFLLKQNGNIVQQGNTKDMIFSFDDLISYLSQFMTLKTGDIIYTGTPAGVGSVKINDHLEAYLENEKLLWCDIK